LDIVMKIHLIAVDLDGTLLNSSRKISPATADTLRAAREFAHVHVVIASARPPRSTMPFYDELGLDTPMINYNGALVYDPPSKRILMHRPLSLKTAYRIVTLARMHHPEVLVSAEILDRWYTDRVDEGYQTETGMLFEPDVVAPISKWLKKSVTKLLLLGDPDTLFLVAATIRKEFLHQVNIVQTEGKLLQISHATVSKEQALKTVAAELGVSQDQVMAIGDNVNDVGMLRWAGVGVAMANSPQEVLDAAKFVTGHHDEDGVAQAIHKVIFANNGE
jgi:Cof subfamily protein (haloacid dehalogenase superfamily)